MSRLVKTATEICKANTNTSTAKFQYSFSKAVRFPNPNLAEEIRTKKLKEIEESGKPLPVPIRTSKYEFYNLPTTLSNRRTTFGKGNKYDFTKVGNNCKVSSYSYKTDFDKNHPHGPMYSFTRADRSGKSLPPKKKKEGEEENKEENKKKELVDIDGPSPAKYNYLKPFGFDAPKYSMKGRHNTPIKYKKDKEGEESEKKEEKPYLPQVTIQIRNTGKYIVSQIPNVNSLKFDKDKSKRSQFVANKNPGPGYTIPPLICHKIMESQYRNYERITMSKRNPIKDSRSNYPGPGSYPIPSDFGQYESKDADKYPKENVYVEERPKFEEKAWRHGMKKIEPKPEIPEENYEDDNQGDNGGETPGYDDNHEETPEAKEETPKKPKKEETPKEEPKKKETPKEEEEDTKSELMLLKDMLVYKEGEAQEFEDIKPNKANEDKKEETPKEEPKKEEPKIQETPKEEPKKEETPKEEPKKEETPKGEEPKKEETPKGEDKKEETPKGEEDKESEAIMLKDILTYREGES